MLAPMQAAAAARGRAGPSQPSGAAAAPRTRHAHALLHLLREAQVPRALLRRMRRLPSHKLCQLACALLLRILLLRSRLLSRCGCGSACSCCAGWRQRGLQHARWGWAFLRVGHNHHAIIWPAAIAAAPCCCCWWCC